MLRNFSRLVMVLGAALLAGAPALHAQSGQPVRGDVDGDGRVTAADARIVSDFLVGKPIPAGANVRERGDVNGDGRVTSVDAAIIARAAAGRDVSRFPVGTPAVEIPNSLTQLLCRADLRDRTVNCEDPRQAANPDGPRGLLVGGQNVYVKLTSSNIAVTTAPGDSTFAFDVTVKNLIPQSLGTTDNVNPDLDSVRVFFMQPPTPTGIGNNGNITIASSGLGTFIASNTHYYQYPGFIAPGATSPARRFHFDVHGSVTTFNFVVAVAAAVQYPAGWVDIYRPDIPQHAPSPYLTYADTVLVNETVALVDSVRNAVGKVVPDAPAVSWGSNNNAVASVDATTGVVTANGVGDAVITATSGPRTGTFAVVVTTTSTANTTITAASPTVTAGDSTLVTVQVKDQFGRNVGVGSPYVPAITLTTDLGTLRGTAAAGTTVTPVDGANGKYTAWLKSDVAGTATVTGTLGGVAIVDNETVTFTAGVLHHFKVEAAAGGDIPAQLVGTPFNVKVTAQDQHNNTVTSFTGTVGFTSTPGGGISAGAGPSAAFVAGVLSSHAITMGTTGDFTLTATVTGGGTQAGTSNSFQVQALPTAVNDGPTPTSVPGDPYHTAFNTTFNLATLGILANDTRGLPLATVVSYGGGDLGGSVTDHAAGTSVTPLPGKPDGSLTVNADGSLAFTPPAGFTGLYTFSYRIGNVRGTSDATVTVAVGVRPAANNDSYPTNLLGNVPINTATSSNFNVTTNDAGDAKVLALGTSTNGTTTLAAGGTFIFTPNAGYTGPASFTYTVTNGFGTTALATVNMTVSGIAWFVDKGAAAGDGRFGTPFNDLSTAFAAATKPQAGQPIFLYSNATAYTGGVTLLGTQRVVGQGATGASFAAVMGVAWPADAGTQPSIGGTRPTVNNGLTLGSGNTLQGFNLGGTSGLTGTGFGTLTFSEMAVNTTGQALNLTTGTLSGSFTGLTSSGGTNNVALSGVTFSGGVDFASGALSGATGTALSITNGTSTGASDVLTYAGSITNATAGAANAAVAVSGGSTRLTLTGNVSQTGSGAAVSVSGGHTGTLTFNTGTVTASNGTGLQFDNADGSYDFVNSPNLSLAGGDAGIDVLNTSGGTFTFAPSAFINNPTGEAIRINSSSPTFTYPGRITKTNGSTGITVSSNSSGTINFGSRAKAITSTGSNVAVNLATNGTATITFADSLVVTSATGNAFNATGGGTVNVAGANNGANNTLASTGGIALNVTSTTIGASGLNFRRIDATGGSNGIFLSATGTSGGLLVTGDGSTNGSGGSIVNTTGGDGATGGNGVYLSSTRNVSLNWMSLSGHQNNGLFGSAVRGLTLNKMRFTGLNGTSNSGTFDESAVHLVDLGGAVKLSNSRFDGGAYNAVLVENITGTAPALDSLVFVNDTVNTGQGSTADVRGTALLVHLLDGTGDIRFRNNYVTYWWGNAIHVVVQGTASGTARITNNVVNNGNGALAGAGGIWVAGGTLAYNISNNNVQNTNGTAISADRANFGSLMSGTIDGNTIGTSGVTNSGSGTGMAIFARHQGPGSTVTRISNNTIRQIAGSANGAISAKLGDDAANGGAGTFNVTMVGNNIAETGSPTNNAQQGIFVEVGAVAGDADVACYDIGGATAALKNTITNFNTTAVATNQNRIRINQRFVTTAKLPGYTGGNTDNAAVTTYLLGRNTVSNVLAQNTGAPGYTNTTPAGSACVQPIL